MRLLLVHRLNLGDLVCASPAIAWLRTRAPQAEIRLLTNDFAAHVGALLPGVDTVLAYRKFGVAAPAEWRQLLRARTWGADRVIGLSPSRDRRLALRLWLLGTWREQGEASGFAHAAERLAWLFGWRGSEPLPPAHLARPTEPGRPRDVAIWVSARKPSNRPAPAQVLALVDALRSSRPGLAIGVFGLPEHTDSSAHIADREALAEFQQGLQARGLALETPALGALFGELAASASVIAPDGGMAHVAAAFGKPVVALFGDVEPAHWRPWSPRAIALQSASRRVPDIAVAQVMQAWEESLARPA